MQYPTNFTKLSLLNKMRKMLKILNVRCICYTCVCVYNIIRCIYYEQVEKNPLSLYRYASCSAAGFSDLIFAVSFDSRHHKTLFCHNLYFTSFLQYIFHYSLWSFCANVCGIEFTIGNVLLSTMPFLRTHRTTSTIEFTSHAAPFFISSMPFLCILHPAGFHFFYHISFAYSQFFFLSRITYNLSVQMRRYI